MPMSLLFYLQFVKLSSHLNDEKLRQVWLLFNSTQRHRWHRRTTLL